MHRIILSGFIAAVFINLPFYAFMTDQYWPWTENFLFVLINNGLSVFNTFFHELGHTITAWLYGVPAIPMFDFVHGGGWSWQVMERSWLGQIAVWAVLVYVGAFVFENLLMRCAIAALIAFTFVTGFGLLPQVIIKIMGPASIPLLGSFFLIRAIYNMAPRGDGERFLNAMFGFALPLHTIIDSWGLTHNPDIRDRYLHQKGGHGVGDFDNIDAYFDKLNFNGVVNCIMVLAVVCLITPFIIRLIYKPEQEC